jgi:hypothetical protein
VEGLDDPGHEVLAVDGVKVSRELFAFLADCTNNGRIFRLVMAGKNPVLKSLVPSRGAAAIAAERNRQVEIEKHDSIEDDSYDCGELVDAAFVYMEPKSNTFVWPFADEDDREDVRARIAAKPYRRRLEIAGALVAAEIDRLDRQEAREKKCHAIEAAAAEQK